MSNVIVVNATGFPAEWTMLYNGQQTKVNIADATEFLASYAQMNNVEQIKIIGATKGYGEEMAQAICAVARTKYDYNNLEVEVL